MSFTLAVCIPVVRLDIGSVSVHVAHPSLVSCIHEASDEVTFENSFCSVREFSFAVLRTIDTSVSVEIAT